MTYDFEGLPAELLVAFPLWNPEAMCILGGSSSLRSYLQKRHFWTKSLLKMLFKITFKTHIIVYKRITLNIVLCSMRYINNML